MGVALTAKSDVAVSYIHAHTRTHIHTERERERERENSHTHTHAFNRALAVDQCVKNGPFIETASKKVGTADMHKRAVKTHITGINRPAHGMYRNLPRSINNARKFWKPECVTAHWIGELEGD